MFKSKELLEKIIREVVEFTFSNKIEVEVIENVAYLSQKDKDILFGAESFAEKTVNIFSKKSYVLSVPVKTGTDETKVYITKTAKNILGIEAPIGYPDEKAQVDNEVRIVGSKGEIILKNGVLVRARYITLPSEIAEFLGRKKGDVVSVKAEGLRAITYENVKIFCGDKKRLHLDLDEANAGDLKNGSIVEILKIGTTNINSKEKESKEVSYKLEKDGIFVKIT